MQVSNQNQPAPAARVIGTVGRAYRPTLGFREAANADTRPRLFVIDDFGGLTLAELLARHASDADLRTWVKTAAIGQSYSLVNALGGVVQIECIHDEDDIAVTPCPACKGTGVDHIDPEPEGCDCWRCGGAGSITASYERREQAAPWFAGVGGI